MRILFLIIPFNISIHDISGQSKKSINKIVTDKFEACYNDNNYDSIFAIFSDDMQKAMPLNKTIEFLKGLKSNAGQITKKQFVAGKENFASYKTNFERGLFTLNISVDDQAKINGLFIKSFIDTSLSKVERNTTKLRLPFNGEWTVAWGGDTKELNYHVENQAQKNAFDIVMTDLKGNSFKTQGLTNEDYYAFGNTEDMNVATGIKCYFDKIIVNGQIKTDYSPIQKDKIKND